MDDSLFDVVRLTIAALIVKHETLAKEIILLYNMKQEQIAQKEAIRH